MRKVIIAICLAALAAVAAHGAGSITASVAPSPGTAKHTIAWTSDASGSVSGPTFTLTTGDIVRIELEPGTGGSQPTDDYDVEIRNEGGFDILQGQGADLSNVTAAPPILGPDMRVTTAEAFSLVVANAGNVKSGVVKIWIDQP